MHIIVIGAGLSGCTSAWELHQAGHLVTVLEARNRVGGRTWSQKLGNGVVNERGGEYIFPTEFAIRRLSAELEVLIMTHNVRYGRRTLRGNIISFAELNATMDVARETLARMIADGEVSISLDDVFRELLGSDFRSNAVYRRIATSAACDTSLLSAEAVLLHESSSAGEYVEDGGRFTEGNQALSLEVARRLGDRIRLEHPITGIDQSAIGVQVVLTDGTRIDGDAAVVTVPLLNLRELELGFELSEAQQRALDHRFMGVAAKLGVPLSRVDADPAVASPDHMWWSWRSLSTDGERRVPALSCFAGGPETLEALRLEGGAGTWLAALKAQRPELQVDGEPLLTTWADDPWAQGAYSAAGLEWEASDARAFDSTAGRVALAGEHTGLAQSMSGAVASGYRASAALQRAIAG